MVVDEEEESAVSANMELGGLKRRKEKIMQLLTGGGISMHSLHFDGLKILEMVERFAYVVNYSALLK